MTSARSSNTPAYVSIRQHTPAYASICQHTPAYASIRQYTSVYVSMRQRCQHTLVSSKGVCRRTATIRSNVRSNLQALYSAYVCMRLHASACASIRQNTSAYFSIRRKQRRAQQLQALYSHMHIPCFAHLISN